MPIFATPWNPDAAVGLESLGALRSGFIVANSRKLLPSEIGELTEAHCTTLVAELQPRGALQQLCVRAIARHAGALDVAAAIEESTLRVGEQGASRLNQLWPGTSNDGCRVAAINNQAVERVIGYGASHERRLIPMIRLLLELQASRQPLADLRLFENEDQCFQHLLKWQQAQPWACPACGTKTRCWIGSGSKFECECGKQYSTRYQTLYSGSHVSLLAWFSAVEQLIVHPDISAAKLSDKLKIVRKPTVTMIKKRVTEALLSPTAAQLLAGVNTLVESHLHKALQRRL